MELLFPGANQLLVAGPSAGKPNSDEITYVLSLVITLFEQEGVCGYLADCRSLGIDQKVSI